MSKAIRKKHQMSKNPKLKQINEPNFLLMNEYGLRIENKVYEKCKENTIKL